MHANVKGAEILQLLLCMRCSRRLELADWRCNHHIGLSTMSQPVLSYPEKSAPLAVLAAARLAGVAIEAKPDAKAAKDSPPTLSFSSG